MTQVLTVSGSREPTSTVHTLAMILIAEAITTETLL